MPIGQFDQTDPTPGPTTQILPVTPCRSSTPDPTSLSSPLPGPPQPLNQRLGCNSKGQGAQRPDQEQQEDAEEEGREKQGTGHGGCGWPASTHRYRCSGGAC